jgi:hypothetical protein
VRFGNCYFALNPYDLRRETKPKAVGNFGQRSSVYAGLTGRFAVNVAQVSTSSNRVDADQLGGRPSRRTSHEMLDQPNLLAPRQPTLPKYVRHTRYSRNYLVQPLMLAIRS